jgi:hypothetical protein
LPTLDDRRRRNVDFKVTISLAANESNAQKEFFSGDETITPSDLPDLTLVIIKDTTIDALEGIDMLYQVKAGVGREPTLSPSISMDIPYQLTSSNPRRYPSTIPLFSFSLLRSSMRAPTVPVKNSWFRST